MTAPVYERFGVTVYAGDCYDPGFDPARGVLTELPDSSVHAIVTDPPYELAFMGRTWDSTGIAFNAAVWRECLRVLKPGGHLLAFGGTRTSHRLACAIEDAGFEIRDSITWLYASGFPKSLDVSKAIDKARGDKSAWEIVGAWLKEQRQAAGITRRDLAERLSGYKNVDSATAVISNWENGLSFPPWERWAELRYHLEFGYEMDSEVVRLNNRKGESGDSWGQREIVGQSSRKSGIANGTKGHYTVGGTVARRVDVTMPATPAARRWQGWGTALKPAFEPIVVARKPLAGTVAANVQEHGTGALNIDATRVSASDLSDEPRTPSTSQDGADSSRESSTGCTCPSRAGALGSRSLSTSLRAGFDVQPEPHTTLPASAQSHDLMRPSGSGFRDGYPTSPRSHGERVPSGEVDDRAGARPLLGAPAYLDPRDTSARTPSTSRSMACPDCTARNVQRTGRWPTNVVTTHAATPDGEDLCGDGCVPGCPVAELDEQSGVRRDGERPANRAGIGYHGGADGTASARVVLDSGGASRFYPVFRFEAKAPAAERPRVDGVAHPTVKPLALMRWLVRLVTPPGGVVLDPFLGSGTTAQAARAEGFHCIGIERDETYLPLIRARLDGAADGGLFGEAS